MARTGLRQVRRRQRMERGINSSKAGRFAAEVLDELIAENDAQLAQGIHGPGCPCEECENERRSDADEMMAANLEYERITR